MNGENAKRNITKEHFKGMNVIHHLEVAANTENV